MVWIVSYGNKKAPQPSDCSCCASLLSLFQCRGLAHFVQVKLRRIYLSSLPAGHQDVTHAVRRSDTKRMAFDA